MKIAYFGDKNSHTFAAAGALYKSGGEFIGFDSVREVIRSLGGASDVAVVPVENSVEGYVNETLDCLLTESVYVSREAVMPIHQSLIAYKGAAADDIEIIYSHPQALSQCRKYLSENFPRATLTAAASTSDGLKKIRSKATAAIARTTDRTDTEILRRNVEDYESNTTRFVALGKVPSFSGEICSIVFETRNEPGALVSVLNAIARAGLNMTKIQSRPAKTKLGRYIFFVDFTFGGSKDELMAFLAELQKYTETLKFLGKYESVVFDK